VTLSLPYLFLTHRVCGSGIFTGSQHFTVTGQSFEFTNIKRNYPSGPWCVLASAFTTF
jgi:hypothetical protein